MATWDVEIIFEPTGTYMNFQYETDTEDKNDIFNEITNQISIIPERTDA